MVPSQGRKRCLRSEEHVTEFQFVPATDFECNTNTATTSRAYQSRRIEQAETGKSSMVVNIDMLQPQDINQHSEKKNRKRSISEKSSDITKPKKKHRTRSKATDIGNLVAVMRQYIPIAARLLAAATYCQYCQAKKFQYEAPSFCCCNGEVQIATNEFPPELDKLFTEKDQVCENFQKYSRLCNNLFAFSCLGGKIECDTKKGIYMFKLHGQIYHYLPNLLPNDGKPKYLLPLVQEICNFPIFYNTQIMSESCKFPGPEVVQLYFYDSQVEFAARASLFKEIHPDIIATIMQIMDRNPYARFFRNLHQIQIQEETTIFINKNVNLDQRVYNAPTTDEVAAIWPDQSAADENTTPYIVVHGKDNKSHQIKHYYGCYDPLQYPLLFPFGENGWHPGIPRSKGMNKQVHDNSATTSTANTAPVYNAVNAEDLLATEEKAATPRRKGKNRDISCREYYAYRLQIRADNQILVSGRLFLQFIVDMYVKIESTRLDFLRNNQSTIRADLYQGLVDSIALGEVEGAEAGHRVILPASFIGGSRDLKKRYLNAMQLVKRFGKPDIFATMTCNPNWPEIKEELADREKAQNRPDLLTRIFRAKLIDVKKEIMEHKIFGEVAAFIYVVEFQKRGLPHAHFLIILETPYKVRCPEDFDKFVSAEIPPPTMPHLRTSVLNHMMHGPCGTVNPQCPCMKEHEGKLACKSHFPKAYASFTTNKEDGYPLYKRSNTGETVRIRGYDMDNRWVIPYNPYLLALFDCHFNVEICSTIQAVKYLYKYVYKGHDRVSFNINKCSSETPVDEIANFQSGRWVSPPEAAWRIFGFDLYEMYPPVMPLNVHCDNNQRVYYGSRENLQAVVSDPIRVRTPLTEFFRINSERPDGPKYLYAEFPEHFVWDNNAKTWTDRKRGKMIGRLAFVNPGEGERYFLRTLLAHTPAPHSFAHIKTVDGIQYRGFQEACLKKKLVEYNNMTEQCLDEAMEFQMPSALRSLFVTLLIFTRPPNPRNLWDHYYQALSEDFRHVHPHEPHTVLALTAEKIEQLLENMGKMLEEFDLQHLKGMQNENLRLTRDIRDVIDAPVSEEHIKARKNLNQKQREAYKCIMHHVKNKKPGAFFIDGPGGTGKTYLYCALYGKLRHSGKIVLTTASSGIAASGLPNGRIAHFRFKLPIDHENNLTCDVPKQGSLAALLKQTTLIIWDEAPMANKASIHALDLLLRDLCDPATIFGGKIVVLGGDFRQVLPVVPHKTQNEAIEASLVSSPLWHQFTRFYLKENMRAKEDPNFAQFLLHLGDGKLQHQEQSMVTLPSSIHVTSVSSENSMNEVIKQFAPENAINWDSKIFNGCAILAPRNDDVDALNHAFIDIFPGTSTEYKSYDSVLDENESIYPTEFLNTLCPGGMSPHNLVLKQNCPVMLLRNIDPAGGMCNGTRLTCCSFTPNLIVCNIAAGSYINKQVFIPRISMRPSASSNYPFQFQRKQFPIKLSFAMTINKSQGQTLNEVGIYLQQPCFSHGQLYVALSRARKASRIRVITSSTDFGETNNQVRNIISFQILSKAGIIEDA